MNDSVWHDWNLTVTFLLALGMIASAYALGSHRLSRQERAELTIQRGRVIALWVGLLVLVIAVLPPLDSMARESLTAHTIQHCLTALLAAPLLVLGAPLTVVRLVMPSRIRSLFSRVSGEFPSLAAAWNAMNLSGIAWVVYAVTFWLWHLPGLHVAALEDDLVHNAMHVSVLAAGLFFWWSLIGPAQSGQRLSGKGILLAFGTAVHSVALGVLLTVSSQPWYTAYTGAAQWGLASLDDQQLAGLIIWISGGIVFVVAGLALVVAWLDAVERDIKQNHDSAQQEHHEARSLTADAIIVSAFDRRR